MENVFKIKIRVDNAAFDDCRNEVGRILNKIADDIQRKSMYGKIQDYNRNTVGYYRLETDGFESGL